MNIVNWRNLEPHELCMVLPPMPDDEFELFRQSIVGNGLRNPIAIYEDKILDGKLRHRVCVQENIEPHFKLFVGEYGAAVDHVIAANLLRQHLTPLEKTAAMSKLGDVHVERSRARRSGRHPAL
jgi:hypothetical protein